MNLGMTILTTASHHADIRPTACRELSPRKQIVHMVDIGMALLAQHRPRRHQQFFMVRTMGCMTMHAIILHRRMLKQKRPTLFRVALITGLVNSIGFQQGPGNTPMRVMTVDTSYFSFQ